jgi:hypothetical protein
VNHPRHRKPVLRQTPCITIALFGVAISPKHGGKGHSDGGNVSMPAHLRYKTPVRPENAPDLRQHLILAAHPMQNSVGKDSIEAAIGIGQRFRASFFGRYAPCARSGYHLGRCIDSGNDGAGS